MTMKSKYNGKCGTCGGPIRKGAEIFWTKAGGAAHFACRYDPASANDKCYEGAAGRRDRTAAAMTIQEDYPCSDRGYEDQCAAACGMDSYSRW